MQTLWLSSLRPCSLEPLFLLICDSHLPCRLPAFCLTLNLPFFAMTLGFGGGAKRTQTLSSCLSPSFTLPSPKLAEAFTLRFPYLGPTDQQIS